MMKNFLSNYQLHNSCSIVLLVAMYFHDFFFSSTFFHFNIVFFRDFHNHSYHIDIWEIKKLSYFQLL